MHPLVSSTTTKTAPLEAVAAVDGGVPLDDVHGAPAVRDRGLLQPTAAPHLAVRG